MGGSSSIFPDSLQPKPTSLVGCNWWSQDLEKDQLLRYGTVLKMMPSLPQFLWRNPWKIKEMSKKSPDFREASLPDLTSTLVYLSQGHKPVLELKRKDNRL